VSPRLELEGPDDASRVNDPDESVFLVGDIEVAGAVNVQSVWRLERRFGGWTC
jgi:hypothetical protein